MSRDGRRSIVFAVVEGPSNQDSMPALVFVREAPGEYPEAHAGWDAPTNRFLKTCDILERDPRA